MVEAIQHHRQNLIAKKKEKERDLVLFPSPRRFFLLYFVNVVLQSRRIARKLLKKPNCIDTIGLRGKYVLA